MYFSIVYEDKVVGLIYLKHIDNDKRTTDFGIALINDLIKGKGYGSEAIRLLINYVFVNMNFKKITADTIIRNIKSQHVLEKVGFIYTHEDLNFKYYKLENTAV